MEGLDYWWRWQVPVCALILLLPAAVSVILIRRRRTGRKTLRSTQVWGPCWTNLNPKWLLIYRAVAFLSMAFLLYHTVAAFGFFVFFFYTQWTFALVMVYFALATIISAHGCWTNSRKPFGQSGERAKFLKNNSDENGQEYAATASKEIDKPAAFWDDLTHSIYQTCAGAVMLTDLVFWCLLLPFMSGENFKLTLLIGCMHSVNALFLILDSALNSLPFTWFGMTYFVLWSCSYVVFQWVVHACCVSWWPYPFLELSTPWAPMWYFALALVHVPCYGLYVLLVRGKDAIFSRMFSNTYVRTSAEKKQN